MAGPKLLLDANGEHVTINEGESSFITGTFVDEDDVAIATLLTLTLTLMEKTTRAVINSRQDDDISASVTAGALDLHLAPDDNVIVLAATAEGDTEDHIAEITWTYTAAAGTATGKEVYEFPVQKDYVPVP